MSTVQLLDKGSIGSNVWRRYRSGVTHSLVAGFWRETACSAVVGRYMVGWRGRLDSLSSSEASRRV
ncbi:hypothetical protein M378DRAFT_384478 [Amanita muscaria Koide BX008]|uniref:Uncharacterized protein n=1 Tax=Amanita muscaria (strain Koide BX008) TaxID=946122 RepID=A0A0C2WMM0_AMAMK|nr:hypothetical protein M378DRAFT_384478 [Amanita muscaria Koide BX008]